MHNHLKGGKIGYLNFTSYSVKRAKVAFLMKRCSTCRLFRQYFRSPNLDANLKGCCIYRTFHSFKWEKNSFPKVWPRLIFCVVQFSVRMEFQNKTINFYWIIESFVSYILSGTYILSGSSPTRQNQKRINKSTFTRC